MNLRLLAQVILCRLLQLTDKSDTTSKGFSHSFWAKAQMSHFHSVR